MFAHFLHGVEYRLLGMVVGFSICVSMTLAATTGTLMPLIFNRCGIDPAVATGPFVTTTIDIIGVMIYFLIATAILL
jgi:magnesium transporter